MQSIHPSQLSLHAGARSLFCPPVRANTHAHLSVMIDCPTHGVIDAGADCGLHTGHA